jgi:hypothetical protein
MSAMRHRHRGRRPDWSLSFPPGVPNLLSVACASGCHKGKAVDNTLPIQRGFGINTGIHLFVGNGTMNVIITTILTNGWLALSSCAFTIHQSMFNIDLIIVGFVCKSRHSTYFRSIIWCMAWRFNLQFVLP